MMAELSLLKHAGQKENSYSVLNEKIRKLKYMQFGGLFIMEKYLMLLLILNSVDIILAYYCELFIYFSVK